MKNINYSYIESKIKPDFLDEFKKIIEDDSFLVYKDFIIERLSEEPVDYKKIFDFGFEHLLSMKDRPDMVLSKFFFLLTSLKQVPKEACDFGTEAVIYCENSEDYDLSIGLEKIKELYNKIRPLLF